MLKNFQETETLKRPLIFRETEPFSPPQENFLYFRKGKPQKKIFLFQEAETFQKSLYFRKRNIRIFKEMKLFIFWEKYIPNRHIFKA